MGGASQIHVLGVAQFRQALAEPERMDRVLVAVFAERELELDRGRRGRPAAGGRHADVFGEAVVDDAAGVLIDIEGAADQSAGRSRARASTGSAASAAALRARPDPVTRWREDVLISSPSRVRAPSLGFEFDWSWTYSSSRTMQFSGQTGMQISQSMQPDGSTTCVRLPVVKKLMVSVGQAAGRDRS